MRKEVPEIGWGDFEVLKVRDPAVLAMRYDWRNNSVVLLHNLHEHSLFLFEGAEIFEVSRTGSSRGKEGQVMGDERLLISDF